MKKQQILKLRGDNLLSLKEGDVKQSAVVIYEIKDVDLEDEVIGVITLRLVVFHVGQQVRYPLVQLRNS